MDYLIHTKMGALGLNFTKSLNVDSRLSGEPLTNMSSL